MVVPPCRLEHELRLSLKADFSEAESSLAEDPAHPRVFFLLAPVEDVGPAPEDDGSAIGARKGRAQRGLL